MSRKPLPSDPAAEEAVLGALLLRPAAIDDVVTVVGEDDFANPRHAALFRAIVRVHSQGDPVDYVTLERELRLRDAWNLCGPLVSEITDRVSSSHNVITHARRVRAVGGLRRFAVACGDALDAACEPHSDPAGWAEAAGDRLAALSRAPTSRSVQRAADHLHGTVQRALTRRDNPNACGIVTPWPALTSILFGFEEPDVTVVAARPSNGKTSFALDVIRHTVLGLGEPGLAFSLEMTIPQLLERLMSGDGRIDMTGWRTGDFGHSWNQVVSSADRLHRAPLYLDDSTYEIGAIRSAARAWRRDRNVFPDGAGRGLIVIDYVGLVKTNRRFATRQDEVAFVSGEVKAMAKELRLPVMLLCQLNRDVERRASHRPNLGDLRESGALEQDADKVVFIHREDRYSKAAPENVAEVIVDKHRNGPIGSCLLDFVPHLASFVPHERTYAGRDS